MREPRMLLLLAVPFAVLACGEATGPAEPLDVVDPVFGVRLEVPEDQPGNPFYALIFNGLEPDGPHFFFPHDDTWGAAIFERELWCVPPAFNLLEEFDFTPAFPGGPPRPFLCPLTVSGFQVWDRPPTTFPVVGGPVMVMSTGLGAVPVVFVHWSEIDAAMEDMVLTLPELLALPSAIVTTADHFIAQYVNGPAPADRLMNKLTANGQLPDGRSFRIQANESQAGTGYHIDIR